MGNDQEMKNSFWEARDDSLSLAGQDIDTYRKMKAEHSIILVVDDSIINRQLLQSLLEKHGYQVREADGADGALEQIQERIPDLILMDVLMPEIDGYELAASINQQYGSYSIPIIFLTALDDTDGVLKGFRAGGADYVRKPFQPEELLARVQTQLELRRSKRELGWTLAFLEEDLDMAHRVQQRILSTDISAFPEIAIDFRYYPLTKVGGDFFDISRLQDHYMRLFVADATGHGIQAALITMLIKVLYESSKSAFQSPQDLLYMLNEAFYKKYGSLNAFFTAIVVDIDVRNLTLIYASAGHPDQVVLHADNEGIGECANHLSILSHTGPLIGVKPHATFFERKINLCAQDKVYLFTDGLLESYSGKKEAEDWLYSILQESASDPIKKVLNKVLDSLAENLEGQALQDDLTFVGVDLSNKKGE